MRGREIAGLDARIYAARILYDILYHHRRLDEAIDRHNINEHALVRAIAAQTLRRLGEIDAILFRYIEDEKPLADSYALMLLRSALAQLLYMRIPAYAAIDLAVSAAKQHAKARHFAPLINAVLRRIARHMARQKQKQTKQTWPDEAWRNQPPWLWQRWVRQYGRAEANAIAAAHMTPAPLDLSFGASAPNINGQLLLPKTWRITERIDSGRKIENMIGYDAGGWWVQDIAASLPVYLLGDMRDQYVLEFCSAPGGKTAQLAAMGAEVRAIEINRARGRRLAENMKRLGFTIDLIITDACDYIGEKKSSRILIDAPCSGTGTCRHHPDLVWRRRARHIARLAAQQKKLLASAYRNLAAGGVLIYAVCSLEAEEGIDIINHFLKYHKDMKRHPITARECGFMSHILTPFGDIRSLPFHLPYQSGKDGACLAPAQGGMDGFYIARLIRADG